MSTRTGMIAAMAAALVTAAGAGPAEARNGRYEYRHYGMPWHKGVYLTGMLGGAFGGEVDFDNSLEIDLEGGFLIGATLGYDHLFAGPVGDFRLEAEVSHRSQDFDGLDGETDLTVILGNLWYDFAVNSRFIPYVGAGLGAGFLDEGNDETGFAWQFGGGVNYHASDRVMVGLNYRYLLADFEVEDGLGNTDVEYAGHQLSVSLGFKF